MPASLPQAQPIPSEDQTSTPEPHNGLVAGSENADSERFIDLSHDGRYPGSESTGRDILLRTPEAKLQGEYAGSDWASIISYAVLRPHFMRPYDDEEALRALAEAHHTGLEDLRQWVHTRRDRLQSLIRQHVAALINAYDTADVDSAVEQVLARDY